MTVTEKDKQAVYEKWQKIVSEKGATLFAPSRAPVDIKKDFCEIWPTADKVLNALKNLLPFPGPIVVGIVLAAGEAASQHYCQGSSSGGGTGGSHGGTSGGSGHGGSGRG